MFRVKIALLVIGGMLCFFGYREFSVSRGSTKDALAVELADLEKESETGNTHLAIGEHFAIYTASVYEYETSSPGEQENEHSKVNFAYYPIISNTHPIFKKTLLLTLQHGGEIPPDKEPELENFTVLVKTKRFDTIGSIPKEAGDAQGVSGLVINRIKSLSSEERNLMQQNFPKVDLDKVLILEEGRTPTSSIAALGMIVGGALLIGLGIMWMIGVRNSSPMQTVPETGTRRPRPSNVRIPNRPQSTEGAPEEGDLSDEEDPAY